MYMLLWTDSPWHRFTRHLLATSFNFLDVRRASANRLALRSGSVRRRRERRRRRNSPCTENEKVTKQRQHPHVVECCALFALQWSAADGIVGNMFEKLSAIHRAASCLCCSDQLLTASWGTCLRNCSGAYSARRRCESWWSGWTRPERRQFCINWSSEKSSRRYQPSVSDVAPSPPPPPPV